MVESLRLLALGVPLLLSACTNKDCDWALDDKKISEQAKGMSLEEMYAFDVRTVKQCTPVRTPLAYDVAGFGEPAKKLALARSQTKNMREFEAALSVISAFNARYDKVCSPSEYALLKARADDLSPSLRTFVEISCTRDGADKVLKKH